MALQSGELSQIIWAETKAFGVASADGSGKVNDLRRLVAQLAAANGGDGFPKRASPPAVTDIKYGGTSKALLAIADSAAEATAPQSRLIIWPAAADSVRPATTTNPPPVPWATMPAEGISSVGPFQLESGRTVYVFSRAPVTDGTDDGKPLVNAVTGTGLPDDRPLVSAAPASRANPGRGFFLFAVALVLFVLAALWAYGVGVASRLTIDEFRQVANIVPPEAGDARAKLPNCDPKITALKIEDLALGAADWRPRADAANAPVTDCRTLYAQRQAAVAKGLNKENSLMEGFASLAISVAGSAGWSVSLVLPLLLTGLALSLLFISAGYGILGRPMGAIIDDRNRMSLTIAQLVLWSIVLLSGWLALGLYNLGFGGGMFGAMDQATAAFVGSDKLTPEQQNMLDLVKSYLVFPSIPPYLYAVLGFAGATPFLSRLISKTAIVAPNPEPAPNAGQQAGNTQDSPQPPTAPTYLDQNSDPSQATLSDMVVKEVAGTGNLVDANRVQHIAITGILVISYAMMLVDAVSAIDPARVALATVSGSSVFLRMPSIDGTFVALLGVSHAALVAAKIFDKRQEAGHD